MIEGDHEIKTLSRSPRQKVRGGKWSARTWNVFTRPKKFKSVLKVMDFCKTFWEIFDFFQKSKTAHFLGQFTTRYTWIGSKRHIPWWPAWKNKKKSTSQIFDFWNFITHFLKWSEEHFSKYQNMWINENLSTRSAKLPVMFYWRELANRCKFFFSSISLSKMGSILGRIFVWP